MNGSVSEDEELSDCIRSVSYDDRYRKGWAYGKQPNAFVEDFVETRAWHPHSIENGESVKLLSLGEGQGRNVWTISKRLGWLCTAVDQSSVGLSKAKLLAKEKNVEQLVDTVCCDLGEYTPKKNEFHVVLSVFCNLPAKTRRRLHSRCIDGLQSGGVVVVQCFGPMQGCLNRESGTNFSFGPDSSQYVSKEELAADFSGFEIIHAEHLVVPLYEGSFHRIKKAALTQFIARKPLQYNCKFPDTKLRKAIDGVICSIEPEFDSSSHHVANRDLYLDKARDLLKHSISSAEAFGGFCQYCWLRECICSKLSKLPRAFNSSKTMHKPSIAVNFVLVIHPSEFFRGSSTGKLLSWVLNCQAWNDVFSCETLYCGSDLTEIRLAELCTEESTKILYPDYEKSGQAIGVNQLYCEEKIKSKELHEELHEAIGSQVEDFYKEDRINIIVPDGSWLCTQSMLRNLDPFKKLILAQDHPFVALDDIAVGSHESRLIESLNAGSGKGRVSTAEAVAMFLEEMYAIDLNTTGLDANSDAAVFLCATQLRAAVSVLADVFFVRKANLGTDKLENCMAGFRRNCPRSWSSWLQGVLKVADVESSRIKSDLSMLGLRWCAVCGAVLASFKRLEAHVRGKRHCAAIVARFFNAEGSGIPVSETQARRVFKTYGMIVMKSASNFIDPIDIALDQLHRDALM